MNVDVISATAEIAIQNTNYKKQYQSFVYAHDRYVYLPKEKFEQEDTIAVCSVHTLRIAMRVIAALGFTKITHSLTNFETRCMS